jgi:hypothetical protein
MDLSGDFTVECWAYFNEIKNMMFASKWGSNQFGWTLFYESGLKFYSGNDPSDYSTGTTTSFNKTITVGQWYHIAVARTGNTLSTFINGVRTATATTTDSNTSNTPTYIGTNGSSSSGIANYGILGYLSDIRIIKGTAAYNGTTYTVPTAPLTAITNTKLLLNMADGQAIDSAAQNNLTLYGTAKTSTAQKKFGTASLLLDGNSDYVAIPAINLTGSFTLEFFAYLSSWPNSSNFDMFYGEASTVYMCFTSGINGSGSDRSIQLAYDPSDYSGIVQFNVNSAMNSGAWHHVAITKNSSNLNVCYIDGTAVTATNASMANTFSTTGTHFIGRGYNPSYHYFGGYIDDFRISQLVRYTSNFTAPSEPFADKGQ